MATAIAIDLRERTGADDASPAPVVLVDDLPPEEPGDANEIEVWPTTLLGRARARFRPARLRLLTRRLGLGGALKFTFVMPLLHRRPGHYSVRVRGWAAPIQLRGRTSDYEVFAAILANDEYGPYLRSLGGAPVRRVIDCGANIGLASIYFLIHCPACRVVAIEPDSGNYDLAVRNLAAGGRRVEVRLAGVWDADGWLDVVNDEPGEGGEWAVTVALADRPDTSSVPAVSIASLVGPGDGPPVDVLKVDIEGAEAVAFGGEDTRWLDRVRSVAVELHGVTAFGDSEATVLDALRRHDFHLSRSGEYTVGRRRPVVQT
jgi:FkbM family methyltransferase